MRPAFPVSLIASSIFLLALTGCGSDTPADQPTETIATPTPSPDLVRLAEAVEKARSRANAHGVDPIALTSLSIDLDSGLHRFNFAPTANSFVSVRTDSTELPFEDWTIVGRHFPPPVSDHPGIQIESLKVGPESAVARASSQVERCNPTTLMLELLPEDAGSTLNGLTWSFLCMVPGGSHGIRINGTTGAVVVHDFIPVPPTPTASPVPPLSPDEQVCGRYGSSDLPDLADLPVIFPAPDPVKIDGNIAFYPANGFFDLRLSWDEDEPYDVFCRRIVVETENGTVNDFFVSRRIRTPYAACIRMFTATHNGRSQLSESLCIDVQAPPESECSLSPSFGENTVCHLFAKSVIVPETVAWPGSIKRLVTSLNDAGIEAEMTTRRNFVQAWDQTGQELRIGDEFASVYSFGSLAEARNAADGINPDGFHATGLRGVYDWIAQPAWYLFEDLILLYISRERTNLDTLDSVAERVAG